ncbi:hypothetical protein SAMN02990966_04627 [Rhodospirillales bacterium URHD0017]|nr:hypothetical protein SAMN02990966_04627 [Rhodospirillales bacterium URHD0017]
MALRLNPAVKDALSYHLMMLNEVCRQDFEVIHFHTDLLHFPLIGDFALRTLTTLHGRLDLPDLKRFYAAFPNVPGAPGGLQITLPIIGGGVAAGGSGSYCHALVRIVDGRVAGVTYAGDNDDFLGKDGVCAPIFRGSLREQQQSRDAR